MDNLNKRLQMAIDWVGLNFTQKKMGKEIMWGSEGDFYTTEEIVEQYLLTQIKKTTDELISELQERVEIAEDELDKLKQSVSEHSSAGDNFIEFLQREKELSISDKKTIERIEWYWGNILKRIRNKNKIV